ncbi:6-phosphogluconolactonase [compost metagenome]
MNDELPLPAGVTLRQLADPGQLADALAGVVAEALREAVATRGQATLVVSGGRSPLAFFDRLARQALPWAQVTVSLADERWVPVDAAASNEGLVRRHLLQGPAAAARFIGLSRPAASLEDAALAADQALAALPPIDVLVLGMGDDGHTASLFPGSPHLALALREDCPRRCLPLLAPSEPRQRLSLSLPLLAAARLPLLAIQGPAKRATLRAALCPGPVADMPIRALLRAPLAIYWCP